MILEITSMQDLNQRKLMDIYSEGNLENTDFFYPEIEDKKLAVEKVEADFLNYIESDFFAAGKNTYVVLEKEDVWVSALRLYQIKDGFYYIEALETRPEFRKKGYASELLDGVISTFKNRGAFQLCDCVSKKNIASLKTHEKVGFEIISEAGIDYLCNETDERDYGMEYKYTEIRTQRLIISPLINEEMKEWIRKENNSDLKQAYEQMLAGCVNHPEQRLWYAIWNIKVLGKDHLSVGDLCFKGLTNRGAVEIGYGIKKEYEGQGYMTEAVQAMAYWASQQEGVENVEAETEPDNHASQRVLEKAGFCQNGVIGKEGPRYEYRKIKIDDSMIRSFLEDKLDYENSWIFYHISEDGTYLFNVPNIEKKDQVKVLYEKMCCSLYNFRPYNQNIFDELFPEWNQWKYNINIILSVGCPEPYDAMVRTFEGVEYMIFDLLRFAGYEDAGYDPVALIEGMITHEFAHNCIHKFYPLNENGYEEQLKYITFDEGFAHLLAWSDDVMSYNFEKIIEAHYSDSLSALKEASKEKNSILQRELLEKSNSGQYWDKFAAISGKLYLASNRKRLMQIFQNGPEMMMREVIESGGIK